MKDTPEYYKSKSGSDVNNILEDYGFAKDFYIGNVIKYLIRAGKKGDGSSDLEKARHYIDLLINYYSV